MRYLPHGTHHAPTSTDDESIVRGRVPRIVSERHNGPRFDPNFPVDQIDGYDNLLLLCKTHHKMIDDQPRVLRC